MVGLFMEYLVMLAERRLIKNMEYLAVHMVEIQITEFMDMQVGVQLIMQDFLMGMLEWQAHLVNLLGHSRLTIL